MVSFSKSVVVGLALAVCGLLGASDPALSADLGPTYAEPATNKWQFSLTPYGWATSMNGDITARGHTVDVNESFIEIVEKSDSLLAWMTLFRGAQGSLRFLHRLRLGRYWISRVTLTSPKIRSVGSTEQP